MQIKIQKTIEIINKNNIKRELEKKEIEFNIKLNDLQKRQMTWIFLLSFMKSLMKIEKSSLKKP